MTKKVTKSKTHPLNHRTKTNRAGRSRRATTTARRRRDLGFNSSGALSLAFFKGKKGRGLNNKTTKITSLVVFAVLFAVIGVLLLQGSKAENKDTYLFDASGTPAVVDSGDTKAVELGVKFRASLDGYVRGIRFYKAKANTGTHTGTLWSITGTKLATGTFTSETASGWQRLTFPNGVRIKANTTYIASYHTPTGHYSANYNFFTADFKRLTLTAPASSTSGGNGVFKYSATSTFPTDTANATNYWVEPIYNRDFSSIVGLLKGAPTSASTDSRAVELGTRFTTDKPGKLVSISFYQNAANNGTHTATLWKADGTKLGSMTYTRNNIGWNQIDFPSPIALEANVQYVVSVHCPNGNYSYTPNVFTQPYDNPPLHAPVNAGMYVYSNTPAFPKNSGPTNYFIQPKVGYASTSTTTPPPPPPSPTPTPTPGPSPYPVSGTRHLYVSPSGDNSDGSSWAKAYRQISTAAQRVSSGTVVHVADGSYGPVLSQIGGTSSAPVTFVSETKWGAKVTAPGQSVVWHNTANYVNIINFDISNATKSGIKSTASYGKFLGNHIHTIMAPSCDGGAGIELENYYGQYNDSIGNVIHRIIVANNTIDCAKNHAIYYQGPNGGRILNNLTYDTSGWGIHLYHNPTNTIIANNTVFNNKKGGIVIGAARAAGDNPSAYASGMKVHNNIVVNNKDSGIREVGTYVGGNTYRKNLLSGNLNGNFNMRSDSTSTRSENIENVDPKFINYQDVTGGDYRLRTDSPAINIGLTTDTVPYDIIYVPRPFGTGYDLGAYEGGY